jgi:alkylation response protein AidB-like acyl-CoA dehydrogenase
VTDLRTIAGGRVVAPDHPLRAVVRRFAEETDEPTGRAMAEAGLIAPHWPLPWGLGADPAGQLAVDDELRRRGLRRPLNPIGIGWAGPTILAAGTDAQRERFLFPLLSGEEIWCQLFSEPDAGSDLASLRTTATRDGDEYVVNGIKVWTTFAHQAAYGILLARTSRGARPQEGITYLICPMRQAGVSVRPIVDLTGTHEFNEVVLDDVRIPVENRVGAEDAGWSLAKVTLANERVSLSTGGVLWGTGPRTSDLLDLVRDAGGLSSPVLRQRAADLYVRSRVLDMTRERFLSVRLQGRQPGPEVSVQKLLGDRLGQRVMDFAKDLAGAHGMLDDHGPFAQPGRTWNFGFLFARALTIGGGTAEVQRNILAERVLSLPAAPA